MKSREISNDTKLVHSDQNSVSVVIPSYNMAWCLERAVASCQTQTHLPSDIIIVDDCSTDSTVDVAKRLMESDARIHYYRSPSNGGHLAALVLGLGFAKSYWVALLDADDELLADSLQHRIQAAKTFYANTGEWPQLVYGDLYWERIAPESLCRFRRIVGRDLPFVYRELSLCQTSTIMLGREAIAQFPKSTNPYNTDDEIVVTIAKHFAFVHSGVPVAVTHAHDEATRMTNSSRRRFRGIVQLVHDHREGVIREHGIGRILLWYLRVLRVFLEWQNDLAKQIISARSTHKPMARLEGLLFRFYALLTQRIHGWLTRLLAKRFEQLFF